MIELDSVSERTKEQFAAIGSADLVVGLADCASSACLLSALDAARSASIATDKPLRTVILYPDTVGASFNGNGSIPGTDPATDAVLLVPLSYLPAERLPAGIVVDPSALLAVASAGRQLSARASCLWSSSADTLSAANLQFCTQAIVAEAFDLALPRYTQLKFGSLLNSGVIAPLTRTLYGQRIPYPMAQDFSFSPRMAEEILRVDPKSGAPRVPQWVPAHAVCKGLRLCLLELGVPPPPALLPADDLSSVLSTVLGSLFQEAEKNATIWHRTRGSQALRTFGTPTQLPAEQDSVEVQGMIEGFTLAFKNLADIWSLVLPPATLLDLKKLTRAPATEFRLSDATWARVIFDFVLAQRQRVMHRDHLLRALTPIYLAWVASHVIAIGTASAAHASARVEQLAQTYETQKPYLLSRWRWPDRFNP